MSSSGVSRWWRRVWAGAARGRVEQVGGAHPLPPRPRPGPGEPAGRRSGWLGSPAIRSSRYCRMAAVAPLTAAAAAGPARHYRPQRPLERASRDSVTWVTPSRPTMARAPWTWWTWVRQNFNWAGSAPPPYWRSASSARSRRDRSRPSPRSGAQVEFGGSVHRVPGSGLIHLEAGDRTLEFVGQAGRFIDGFGRALGAHRRLLGDAEDFLHQLGDVGRRFGLLLGR